MTAVRHVSTRGAYLVDASYFVFRSYFALPEIQSPNNEPVQAVLGFANYLSSFLQTAPRYVGIFFDESLRHDFRNRLYPAYKQNRPEAPPELKQQFIYCKRVAQLMGCATFSSCRYEADDLIASAAQVVTKRGLKTTIYTCDKDLLQLVSPLTRVFNARQDKCWDIQAVKRHYGVRPKQLVDIFALTGDAIDNIPGVRGVGFKTARKLIQRYHDIDGVYAELATRNSRLLSPRIDEALVTHKREAYLSRKLFKLESECNLRISLKRLMRQKPQACLGEFFTGLGLKRLAQRYA